MFALGFIKAFLDKKVPQKATAETVVVSEDDVLEKQLREYYQLSPEQFTFNPETTLSVTKIDEGMQELQDFMERSTVRSGYPASDVDILMSINHGRVDRLLTGSGIPREMAEKYLLPCIRNLAKVVHLIPASRSYHHRNCGGLFKHSLDVAWRANQKARTKYFRVPETVGDKSTQQDKWMIACMIGALCHDAGKVVTVKPSPHSMHYYGPYSGETLYDWIKRECDKRYYVEWTGKGKEHEKAIQTVFSNIVPNETLAWLGNNIARELVEFCQGELTPEESVLTEVITLSDSESTRYNRLNGEFDYNNPNEADYLLTAIRRLIMIPRIHKATTQRGDTTAVEIRGVKVKGFSINTPHSELLLFSDDKLFLCWEAFREVRKIYQLNSVDSHYLAPGMERDLDEDEMEVETLPLLDFLEKEGYISLFPDKTDSRTRRYRWWIGHYNSSKPNEPIKPFRAICFNGRAIARLFEDEALPTPIRTQVYFYEGPDGPAEITHSVSPVIDPSAVKPGAAPKLKTEQNPSSFGPAQPKPANNGTGVESGTAVETEDLQSQLQEELNGLTPNKNGQTGQPGEADEDGVIHTFSTKEPNGIEPKASATEELSGKNTATQETCAEKTKPSGGDQLPESYTPPSSPAPTSTSTSDSDFMTEEPPDMELPPLDVYLAGSYAATNTDFNYPDLTEEELAIYEQTFPDGFEPVIRMENPWVVYLKYPAQDDGTPGISITTRFEGDCSEANWTAIVHVPLGLDYEEPSDKRYSVVRERPSITGRQIRNAVVKNETPATEKSEAKKDAEDAEDVGNQVTGERSEERASATTNPTVNLSATEVSDGMNTTEVSLAENASLRKSSLTETVAHSLSQASGSANSDPDEEDSVSEQIHEDDWNDDEVRALGDGKGKMTLDQFGLALHDDLRREAKYRRVQAQKETDTEIIITYSEMVRLCTLHEIDLSKFFVQSKNLGFLEFDTQQMVFTYQKNKNKS